MSRSSLRCVAGGLLAHLLLACGPRVALDYATCGQEARCGDGPAFIVDELSFVVEEDEQGRIDGFDLDGFVSDSRDPDGCNVPDRVAPDGRQGIDNRLPELLNLAGPTVSALLPDAVKNAISSGSLLVLLEFVPDPELQSSYGGLVFRRGLGPPLLGTHGNFLPGQTFGLEPRPFMGAATGSGSINEWSSDLPFEVDFRFTFLGTPIRLPLRETRLEARLEADGSLTGKLGAWLLVEDVLAVTAFVGGDDEAVANLLRLVVPQLADIRTESGECDAISMAMRFRAVPAFIFPEVHQGPLTGEQIFVRATCQGCHFVEGIPGNASSSGPPLNGLASRAAAEVSGMSARDYVRQSILEPGAHVVAGYENTMPAAPGRLLPEEELETLVAWLLSI